MEQKHAKQKHNKKQKKPKQIFFKDSGTRLWQSKINLVAVLNR